jgi:hypothetical protein
MKMAAKTTLALALLLAGACKDDPPPATAAGPSPLQAPGKGLSVAAVAKLEEEARSRPPTTLKAESVLDALERAGFRLVRRNQYVGAVVGASFCMGGSTASGFGISVCEYADVAAAERGRTNSLQRYRSPPREIYLNKKTTLTVIKPTRSPSEQDADASVRKIGEIFSKL